MKEIVFATNNPHKLREVREIAGDKFIILSLADIGCEGEIPETADSLTGNALQKARWIKSHYGYDCFADDTGLMVEALGGQPGVRTARYAGDHCSPDDNIDKILDELKKCDNRNARFATVIAWVTDKEEFTFEGAVDGTIAHVRKGDGGFGYDPIFIPNESGIAFAEMSPKEKNRISHRARAVSAFMDFLAKEASK